VRSLVAQVDGYEWMVVLEMPGGALIYRLCEYVGRPVACACVLVCEALTWGRSWFELADLKRVGPIGERQHDTHDVDGCDRIWSSTGGGFAWCAR
jgi:hypothetical protein